MDLGYVEDFCCLKNRAEFTRAPAVRNKMRLNRCEACTAVPQSSRNHDDRNGLLLLPP